MPILLSHCLGLYSALAGAANPNPSIIGAGQSGFNRVKHGSKRSFSKVPNHWACTWESIPNGLGSFLGKCIFDPFLAHFDPRNDLIMAKVPPCTNIERLFRTVISGVGSRPPGHACTTISLKQHYLHCVVLDYSHCSSKAVVVVLLLVPNPHLAPVLKQNFCLCTRADEGHFAATQQSSFRVVAYLLLLMCRRSAESYYPRRHSCAHVLRTGVCLFLTPWMQQGQAEVSFWNPSLSCMCLSVIVNSNRRCSRNCCHQSERGASCKLNGKAPSPIQNSHQSSTTDITSQWLAQPSSILDGEGIDHHN